MAPRTVLLLLVTILSLQGSDGIFNFFQQALNKVKDSSGMYASLIEMALQSGMGQLDNLKTIFSEQINQMVGKVMENAQSASENIETYLSSGHAAGASIIQCASGKKELISDAAEQFVKVMESFLAVFLEKMMPIVEDMQSHFQKSFESAKNVMHNVTECASIPCLVSLGSSILREQMAVVKELKGVVAEHMGSIMTLSSSINAEMVINVAQSVGKFKTIAEEVHACVQEKMGAGKH